MPPPPPDPDPADRPRAADLDVPPAQTQGLSGDQPDEERARHLPPGSRTASSQGVPGDVGRQRPYDEVASPDPTATPRPDRGGRTATSTATRAPQVGEPPRITDRPPPGPLGPAQALTAVLAVGFLGLGIAGAVTTGWDGFFDHRGEEVLGFSVNPFHNTAHLAWGALGLVAVTRRRWTLVYGAATAVAYAGLLLYGLVAVDQDWDVLAINHADNWLHLGLAVAGAAIAAIAGAEGPRHPEVTIR